MRQNLHLIARYLLCCACLLVSFFTQAQRLDAPQLSFAYACVSDSFNNFQAIVSYENAPFNAENEFFLELSDASGSFEAPETLKIITGENYSFDFETSFSFPLDVAGENYKIRIRATSPAMISPATDAFNAFYVPEVNLILNNYEDIAVCGGDSATISLNVDVAPYYIWYRNGEFYREGGNSLDITSSGEYYAEGFYGDCTGAVHSNIVIVNFGEEIVAAIEGESTIEACEGTTHTFRATVDNEFLDYKWFKDGVELTDLPTYAPELPVAVNGDSYGSYSLMLVNEGGCSATSESVLLSEPQSSATVTAVSDLENILIGTSVTLRISTTASNSRISWFKDETLISNGTASSIEVTTPGSYHAKVSAAGSCLGVVRSQEFKVYAPVSFTATIQTDANYSSCESSSTAITLASIEAKAVNGLQREVLPAQFDYFQFNWNFNNAALNETGVTYTIDNYNNNGNYFLSGTLNNLSFESNTLAVKLALPEVSLTADTQIICSNNQNATLEVTSYSDARYNWYKDGELYTTNIENTISINEAGTYHVEVLLNGCITPSNELEISPISDDLITVFPSETIAIGPNSSEVIFASGGDTYLWTNEAGEELSAGDSFSVNTAGTYTLIATVDGCEIIKTIQVELLEVVEVPNIISPNQDNINDKWVLPAKYLNDPEIQVTICDTYGTPVLKTNSYQNNWPESSLTDKNEASIYYYMIQKNGKSIKRGSITVVSR